MCCPNPWPVWLLESWLLRCVYLETNQTDNCGRFCSIRGNPFAARCLGSISQEIWTWFCLLYSKVFCLTWFKLSTKLASRCNGCMRWRSIILYFRKICEFSVSTSNRSVWEKRTNLSHMSWVVDCIAAKQIRDCTEHSFFSRVHFERRKFW